jgi:segregation and condensation protein B
MSGASLKSILSRMSPQAFEEATRICEALLFASAEPLPKEALAERISAEIPIDDVLSSLRDFYAGRGVHLVEIAGQYTFRTAPDLAGLLIREQAEPKKLSRAALETLAIIAYHQPTTRAEIEDIRGVSISRGTLDVLMETGWVRMRGRRRTPGRPVTYGTSAAFLSHFGLASLDDLPGLNELKGAGFFDTNLPSGFAVPTPSDSEELQADEDPLDLHDPAAMEDILADIDAERAE